MRVIILNAGRSYDIQTADTVLIKTKKHVLIEQIIESENEQQIKKRHGEVEKATAMLSRTSTGHSFCHFPSLSLLHIIIQGPIVR